MIPLNTADLGTDEKAAVLGVIIYNLKTLIWDLEMGGGIGRGGIWGGRLYYHTTGEGRTHHISKMEPIISIWCKMSAYFTFTQFLQASSACLFISEEISSIEFCVTFSAIICIYIDMIKILAGLIGMKAF